MSSFNYGGQAGLFVVKRKYGRISYRRFENSAEAIRFAVEELPADLLHACSLEIDENAYDGRKILELYESPDFPLQRRAKRST
jgi:hypothetical protein